MAMRRRGALLVLMLAAVAAAAGSLVPGMSSRPAAMTQAAGPAFPPGEPDVATAVFASGCFWCTQFDFDKLDGVVETTTGYIGGWSKRPTYYQVATGRTGHVEALQVKFDPGKLSYGKLLDYYWRHVDPLDGGGQFCDRGNEYRPVIFTTTEAQATEAEASKVALEASKRFPRPIKVAVEKAGEFWPAEPEHQKFYQRNPLRYMFYRLGCGRDARLQALWGKEAATN